MAAQDELYRMFLAVSGQQERDFAPITFALAELIAQLGEVQRSTAATQAATRSASAASTAQSQSEKSESVLEKALKSGFGVSPIVAGLIDLFTGSDEPPPPLMKFALPPSIAFQAAETRDGFTPVDFDQGGLVRQWRARAAEAPVSGPAATQQITVNVQAMDARSFLDRSGDIALAVREAMLNLNSINDVVNDL